MIKRPRRTQRKAKLDWPAIAVALAAQIPHTALHPTAMRGALKEFEHEKKAGGRPSRWAVAFSGGADSLALLLILWAEGPGRWERDFIAMHFNHKLRGRVADADEKFCSEVCAALGITFIAGTWKGAKKTASEAEARTARHAFFSLQMKRRKMRLLWLGHQRDDIAETMLMRLARGSGTGGLAAPRPLQATADQRLHLRPLLTLRKVEIIAALKKAGATWREDATNAQDDFFRNRVRRRVLPSWAKAAGRDALAGAALSRERLEEDDVALESWVDSLPLFSRGGMDVAALKDFPRAVKRRALHRWLLRLEEPVDLSRQAFEVLLAAIEKGSSTRFSLGRQGFAVLRRGVLSFQAA